MQGKLTKALRDHHLGYNVASEKRTVRQWLQEWLEHHVKPSVRPKTYTFYECIIRNWITPYLGNVLLQKLTPTRIQTFLKDRTDSGLAPKTVRHIHRTLTSALAVAEGFGYVPRNVSKLVAPVHVPKPAVRFFTVAEARTFLAAAAEDRLYALFAVILALGLRLGEALGLAWADVDLDHGRLTVRYALQRVRPEGEKKRSDAGGTKVYHVTPYCPAASSRSSRLGPASRSTGARAGIRGRCLAREPLELGFHVHGGHAP